MTSPRTQFSSTVLTAAAFFGRVLGEDEDAADPVAIATYENCPVYGEDYSPSYSKSDLTLSLGGCATSATVYGNTVTYTSLVRTKVRRVLSPWFECSCRED
jgi:hypothetical protein